MSGKTSGLTLLQTRKELLLAESEINRMLLLREAAEVKQAVLRLGGQVGSAGPITALAVQIGTSFAGIFQGVFRRNPAEKPGKLSRLSAVFKSLRAGAILWSVLRSHWR